MRREIWTDKYGYRRVSLLRDNDPSDMVEAGLPVTIASDLIDWDEAQRELNNILIDRSLFTLDDLLKSKDGLRSAILYVFMRKLQWAYRSLAEETSNAKSS